MPRFYVPKILPRLLPAAIVAAAVVVPLYFGVKGLIRAYRRVTN